MTAPADDEIRLSLVVENACVAQDVVHGVRDARRIAQIEAIAAEDGIVDVNDVAQHREQVFLDTADHLAVDERARRRIADFELDAPSLSAEANLKVLVAIEDRTHVIGLQSRRQHGKRATAKQLIDAALTGGEQLLDFALGEVLETAER
jgi:hypothetical protein